MTITSISTDREVDAGLVETKLDSGRIGRTPFAAVSQTSRPGTLLGVTMVALGGSPRLALRAALVVLQDSHVMRSSHDGRTHRRSVRRLR
jgi:hypothetical protein